MSTFTTFEVPARITAPPRRSERHPWIYPVAVFYTVARAAWARQLTARAERR